MNKQNRWVHVVGSSLFGATVAYLLAPVPLLWPAALIGAGAVVSAVILLLYRRDRKYYSLTGTVYLFQLAVAINIVPRFPESYTGSPQVSLLIISMIGILIFAVRAAGGRVVRRIAAAFGKGSYAKTLYDALSSLAVVFSAIWTIITAQEKGVRYAGVLISGLSALIFDFFAIEMPIDLWFIDPGLNLIMLVFVASVLGFFYMLESLHTTWYAVKSSAKKGANAGTEARSRVSEFRQEGGEK
jgi:hypothetical protein